MNLLWSLVLSGSLCLALGCSPPPGATNIARDGEASQDSIAVDGNAKNAIDGNKDGTYSKGSCTHTSGAQNPWWKLNLKKKYKISTVVLTNRQDCCPERLMGAEIRIGNDPNNNNTVCGKVTNVTNANLSFCCDGMEGQYISVVIPGRAEALTLCEVEVYGDPVTETLPACIPPPGATNIARGGEASQDSIAVDGNAKNAIDGNKDGTYSKGSCTHTSGAQNPWWKLNLKKKYKISTVVLTNRQDCCPERLLGAEIRIGNDPNNNNTVCGKVMNVTNANLSFCCDGMEGQYISVVIPGRAEALTLCEVEVYGDPVTETLPACIPPPGATNIARDGEASQDSVGYGGNAKNAIDGNKDGTYSKGSCTHTSGAQNPWWKLNLKKKYKISTVVLTNRQDCCPERLMGAEIRIGNDPNNNNTVCNKVTNVTNANLPFCCDGMEGQYISVVIPGRAEALTLCEVEIYGDPVTEVTKENKVCW
ncbi:uncharacterized protein [Dendropsophus ebraccatus]|uniref:uncharacterized protein n=1 Tax=Dendropsophus ebraccatus TaxID=150705 RepID=UPI0038317DCD